jgi:DNA-binding FadR family transcriptional regulator
MMEDGVKANFAAGESARMFGAGTLTDRMTELLKQRIRNGEYPAGSRLPTEQAMSEGFGVSRTVIREAVSRLRADGLVDVRQGRGTEVLAPQLATAFRIDFNPDDYVGMVERVTELRRGIEAEGASLAAERRTDAHVVEIRRALAAIDDATQAGRDGVDEDFALHNAISLATGNPLYPSLLDFLSQFIRASIRVTRSNEASRSDFAAAVRCEHMAIAEAIADGDPVRAREAVIKHIDNVAVRIRTADPAFWAAQKIAPAPLGDEALLRIAERFKARR